MSEQTNFIRDGDEPEFGFGEAKKASVEVELASLVHHASDFNDARQSSCDSPDFSRMQQLVVLKDCSEARKLICDQSCELGLERVEDPVWLDANKLELSLAKDKRSNHGKFTRVQPLQPSTPLQRTRLEVAKDITNESGYK